MIKRMTEEQQQKMAKLQSAAKKALNDYKKKNLALKQKCQNLVQRVGQLTSEKAAALKLCEENKHAYEQRLRDMSVNARGDASVHGVLNEVSVHGAQHRSELRAIMERLEANKVHLKMGSGSLSEPRVGGLATEAVQFTGEYNLDEQ